MAAKTDLGLRIDGVRTLLKNEIKGYGSYITNVDSLFNRGAYGVAKLEIFSPDQESRLGYFTLNFKRTNSCCAIIEAQGLTSNWRYSEEVGSEVLSKFLDSVVEQFRLLRDRALEEGREYNLGGGTLMINDTNNTLFARALAISKNWELIEEFVNPKTGNTVVWYKNIR